jgi:hypothetical protein
MSGSRLPKQSAPYGPEHLHNDDSQQPYQQLAEHQGQIAQFCGLALIMLDYVVFFLKLCLACV